MIIDSPDLPPGTPMEICLPEPQTAASYFPANTTTGTSAASQLPFQSLSLGPSSFATAAPTTGTRAPYHNLPSQRPLPLAGPVFSESVFSFAAPPTTTDLSSRIQIPQPALPSVRENFPVLHARYDDSFDRIYGWDPSAPMPGYPALTDPQSCGPLPRPANPHSLLENSRIMHPAERPKPMAIPLNGPKADPRKRTSSSLVGIRKTSFSILPGSSIFRRNNRASSLQNAVTKSQVSSRMAEFCSAIAAAREQEVPQSPYSAAVKRNLEAFRIGYLPSRKQVPSKPSASASLIAESKPRLDKPDGPSHKVPSPDKDSDLIASLQAANLRRLRESAEKPSVTSKVCDQATTTTTTTTSASLQDAERSDPRSPRSLGARDLETSVPHRLGSPVAFPVSVPGNSSPRKRSIFEADADAPKGRFDMIRDEHLDAYSGLSSMPGSWPEAPESVPSDAQPEADGHVGQPGFWHWCKKFFVGPRGVGTAFTGAARTAVEVTGSVKRRVLAFFEPRARAQPPQPTAAGSRPPHRRRSRGSTEGQRTRSASPCSLRAHAYARNYLPLPSAPFSSLSSQRADRCRSLGSGRADQEQTSQEAHARFGP
ncbi:hypothetical protein ASPZODRAFT_320103 [Penicilliopsis zonata CBS 506.65]|uniref:Uncharacterized protein n=1 Tax=Penicilliopsis zonata CBS 506.65 TaxID=1073090 RepID=A0A1L9SVE4_9EURO|nr:hypothetical protein ASPZODRAFT_320103 [Penicilliopsis zonata CBS 506.65]OJJ51116.1 hypothetical protein ASPZODRAFT_320103 [Penicilliopsis zonata CBS 506.65]